jgi:hypothetical protein
MVEQPDAAKELVKYLSLPSSVPVIRKNGMDPAQRHPFDAANRRDGPWGAADRHSSACGYS